MQSIRVSEFYIAIEKKIQHLREGKAKKGFCMAFLNFAKPIYRMRFVTYSGLMLNASFRNISNAECYYLSGAYSGILTERGISFSMMVTISLWGAPNFFLLTASKYYDEIILSAVGIGKQFTKAQGLSKFVGQWRWSIFAEEKMGGGKYVKSIVFLLNVRC